MASVADCPIMFLDVDGVLIPLRARPTEATSVEGCAALPVDDDAGNPLLGRLDQEDGRRLLSLGCQLVWATTWMSDANELVAPRLGLPELPVVDFPDDDGKPEHGLHWKTRFLIRWAAGRTFVWLDDEVTDADRRWVRANYAGNALLHRADPTVGVTATDFEAIRRWIGRASKSWRSTRFGTGATPTA
ncbi:hypothetical protein Drose_37300 [Dactylosporangium roseum]|uniref:Secreted protein n=1 Tax=Dactylosporangium roseum TaxID=47989 RepID=A0ABY5Z888_9ACTN|nr:HAD domain-containing protein [Dactylosporangium roseum]UWZ36599.1 hypothetical protein Drose_37300 [Dactylosporangium roseum]